MVTHILSILLTAPHLSKNAYLDPGSGSFLLQILLAALLGSLFFFRSFWSKVVNYFRKGSAKVEPDAEPLAMNPEEPPQEKSQDQ
jgi:hypothetical protein